MSEIVDCISWVIRKTCWSFFVFMKFIFMRFLDILGLIFNVAACCTIVRLPFMIAQFSSLSGLEEWRYIGIVHLLIFLMDIPIIIMGLIVLVTLWRVYPCVKELKKEWKDRDEWADLHIYWTGPDVRYVIVKHFFTLFIDVFCIPSAIICLLSWRSYIFVQRIKNAKNDWKRRKYCFQECCQVFLDIPLLICFIPVILSWRLPFLVNKVKKDVSKDKKWNSIRCRGIEQLLYLLVDIPCIVLFLLTLMTWRSPILVWQMAGVYHDDFFRKKNQWKVRKMIMLQFLYLFLDIPCIVAFIFIIGTIWRIPSMLKGLKEALSKVRQRFNFYKKEFEIREVIIVQFVMIFVDLFCLLMTIILLASLWRAFAIIQEIRKYIQRYRESSEREAQKRSHYGTFGNVSQVAETNINEPATEHQESETDKSTSKPDEKKSNDAIEEEHDGNEMNDSTGKHKDNKIDESIVIIDDNEINESTTDQEDDVIVGEVTEPNTAVSSNEDDHKEGVSHLHITDIEYNHGDETDEEKKPLSWSKCTWKIRKAISINFVMLFIDIPAIPLALFLIITALRTSAFLSAVIGSGDFYMFFAVTVYYQTLRFFIDLFFLFLFIILMFLRPIQSWVHLLEDEEHKKYRLLRDIMVWVPDINADRPQAYDELDEKLMLDIKENTDSYTTRSELDDLFSCHLHRIEKLIANTEKYEIEDEFCYLLKHVLFLEKKRPGKLMRKYQLEQSYIMRTDVQLHKSNLFQWDKEMREFNQIVDTHYKKLLNYKPEKVPLYEKKSGLSLRSRKETRKVLIDCLPRGRFIVILMAILCCIPLYRAPSMIKKLFKRWYNKYNIVTNTMKEYALDMLAVLRILIVLVCVYRAPVLFADIFDCIIEKRSWRAVRSIVKKYPGDILDDILNLLSTLFSWESPRFVVTAILFGLLMPADMFLTVVKICIRSKCMSYLLTLFIYMLIMGFPFVFALYGANEILRYGIGWVNIVFICVFSGILFFILLLMVMALVKDKKKTFLLEMPKCDYVRLNWYNINVFLFEVIEFFQTMALIFKLTSIPMHGNSVFSDASKYLLFSFLPFKFIFWITVTMFVVWFFLCAYPVISENILEKHAIGSCGKRASWRLAISLFANTLFVTMVENLISFSACQYESCPSNFTLGNIPANSSCITSKFIEDSSLNCWSGTHRNYAVFGLIGLVWYCTTSLIFDTQYGDPDTSKQDIGFSPIYNTVINVIKGIMVVAVSIVTDNNYAVLGVLLACNSLSIVFSLSFRMLFRYKPSNLPSALVWRVFTYISCSITTIAVIVAFILDDKQSKIPLLIIGVGILIVFIISVIVTIKLRQISNTERDRKAFREEILSLEIRVTKNKWFLKKWENERNMWNRLVKSVREASQTDRNVKPEDWTIPEQQQLQQQAVAPEFIPIEIESPPENVQNNVVERMQPNVEHSVIENDVMTEESDQLKSDSEAVDGDVVIRKFSGLDYRNIPLPPSPSLPSLSLPPPSYDTHVVHNVSLLLHEVDERPKDVYRLEKNGRNLLLILEKLIRYDAYRYSFLSQRNIWRNAVWKSDWTGLLQSLRILNSNLLGTFNQPTHLDISLSQPSLPEDKLTDDPQDDCAPPPVFVRQTKEMIARNSEECRHRALDDFSGFPHYGTEWKQLFDKLLPTHPVIKSWEYTPNGTDSVQFILISLRPNTGTIAEIDTTKGNKLAKGASFTIGKVLRGTLDTCGLRFEKGYEPVAKKGPVNITVKDVSFITKNKVLYLCANGKKVKFDVALASCKTVTWT